jgi:hypothetical protein
MKKLAGILAGLLVTLGAMEQASAASVIIDLQAAPSSFDLPTFGTTDWKYFRTNAATHEKASATNIGTITATGTAGFQSNPGLTTITWSGAEASPFSGTDTDFYTNGTQAPGTGRLNLSVTASTAAQRLYVIFGGRANPALSEDKTFTIGATLSDGSGVSDSKNFLSLRNGGVLTLANNFRMAVIDFTADNTSTLTLDISNGGIVNTSYMSLMAVALAPGVAVPEPSTYLSLLLGAAGLVLWQRRRLSI